MYKRQSSSSAESSPDSGERGDGVGPKVSSDLSMPPPPPPLQNVAERRLTLAEKNLERARVPLQLLRNLIEDKLRAKARTTSKLVDH